MRRLLRQATIQYPTGALLVIDNAPAHCEIEHVFQEPEFSNFSLIRLAPYSPQLNPIENVWSMVKAAVKRIHAANINSLLSGEERGILSVQEYRMQCLENYIATAITEINAELIINFVSHIQSNLASAINMEDIIF